MLLFSQIVTSLSMLSLNRLASSLLKSPQNEKSGRGNDVITQLMVITTDCFYTQ